MSGVRRSRFVVTAKDRADLWLVVARHRRKAGDIPGAKMARWQSANIRSQYPTPRPEDM